MTDAKLWLITVATCGAAWLIAECFNRRDQRVDLLESYRLDLDDDEALDRLEAELDHRAIRAIDDAYGHGRWTR